MYRKYNNRHAHYVSVMVVGFPVGAITILILSIRSFCFLLWLQSRGWSRRHVEYLDPGQSPKLVFTFPCEAGRTKNVESFSVLYVHMSRDWGSFAGMFTPNMDDFYQRTFNGDKVTIFRECVLPSTCLNSFASFRNLGVSNSIDWLLERANPFIQTMTSCI